MSRKGFATMVISGSKVTGQVQYILTSNKETLKKKDAQAAEDAYSAKGASSSTLRKPCAREAVKRYNALIKENKLLFTADR